MNLGFKPVLLFLLLIVVLHSSVTAGSEKDNSQRLRAAPLRDTRDNVIDGTGSGEAFISDRTTDRLDERKGGNSRVSVSTVALFTLAMAAATGLGAVPFFFVELDAPWAGICNGMAAGVMLAASFDLVQEGRDHGSGNWVVIGILAGGIFVWLCKKVMTYGSFIFAFLSLCGPVAVLGQKYCCCRQHLLVFVSVITVVVWLLFLIPYQLP